ncbi:hypothetical protein [Flavobacterium sp.]|jgi:hypothetical protein|uniref:hypothetical protein n=1 Tax=Flavobacterium sp. TaxID=239 RepID=UPI0037C04E80
MENKETAVEWLISQQKHNKFYDIKTIEQAKKMQKEQIINSFDSGYFNYEVLFYDNAEEYYNEIYGTIS